MVKFRNVVVGISGGVDSAVAALLLKQKGFNVQGVFMQNWDVPDEKGYCSADADYKDATFICDKLNIKLTHVNFVKQYWNEVFSNVIKEYETGTTPNPDILCNRSVKFSHFLKFALEILHADAIATGHYATTSFGPFLENYQPNTNVKLFSAKDPRKDQVFFLCQISQQALQRTMFPLGNLFKSQVKQIAYENGLGKIAKKRESMGICFIGQRNFQDFITQYVEDKPGDFVNVTDGKIVAQHQGIHQFTLGQRTGINSLPVALFVAKKDVEKNIIYVVPGTKHSFLHSNLVFTSQPFWIHSQPKELENGDVLECKFKFQHTQQWVDCEVCQIDKGLVIKVDEYKRAVTPGQYAVLSKSGECLGSAKIANSGVSHFSLYYLQNKKIQCISTIINKYFKKSQTDDGMIDENVPIRIFNR